MKRIYARVKSDGKIGLYRNLECYLFKEAGEFRKSFYGSSKMLESKVDYIYDHLPEYYEGCADSYDRMARWASRCEIDLSRLLEKRTVVRKK